MSPSILNWNMYMIATYHHDSTTRENCQKNKLSFPVYQVEIVLKQSHLPFFKSGLVSIEGNI